MLEFLEKPGGHMAKVHREGEPSIGFPGMSLHNSDSPVSCPFLTSARPHAPTERPCLPGPVVAPPLSTQLLEAGTSLPRPHCLSHWTGKFAHSLNVISRQHLEIGVYEQ